MEGVRPLRMLFCMRNSMYCLPACSPHLFIVKGKNLIFVTLSYRGKFRSKPWQQLLEEAKYLVESGVKELNLIAEDTNQYGQDRRDGKGLAQLMHELGKLEGLQWMRILYAYPSYFTDDLIDEIASNPKVSCNLQLSSYCMPFWCQSHV